jgi:hypothetical protein
MLDIGQKATIKEFYDPKYPNESIREIAKMLDISKIRVKYFANKKYRNYHVATVENNYKKNRRRNLAMMRSYSLRKKAGLIGKKEVTYSQAIKKEAEIAARWTKHNPEKNRERSKRYYKKHRKEILRKALEKHWSLHKLPAIPYISYMGINQSSLKKELQF